MSRKIGWTVALSTIGTVIVWAWDELKRMIPR